MATTNGVTVDDADVVFTDVTTGDVSDAAHGFCPKAPDDAAQVLLGSAAFGLPTVLSVPSAAPTLSGNAKIQFYLDEGANKLMVRVKYAAGTQKTGEVALT